MLPPPAPPKSRGGTAFLMVALGAGFGLAGRVLWEGRSPSQPPAALPSSLPLSTAGTKAERFDVNQTLTLPGSASLPAFFLGVQAATAAEITGIAQDLLADPRRARDDTLWALVLARWSQVDPAGMMEFATTHAGETCATLPAMAWKAWGATRPEDAFAAAKNQPEALRKAMLQGVAAVDPSKAAEFALGLPNAQFAIGTVIGALARQDIKAALNLLQQAVYDGAREPIQRAIVEELAKSDPDQALAMAREAGRIWNDREAEALSAIARHHPDKAREMVESMPSSRAKALSAVAVAKTLAADDPEAALTWTRTTLKGPVRDAALVEIASATGGTDPVAGLSLLAEAGWRETGDMYLIQAGQTSDTFGAVATSYVATSLLRQWAATDPNGAHSWLETHVPEALKAQLATAAGFTP